MQSGTPQPMSGENHSRSSTGVARLWSRATPTVIAILVAGSLLVLAVVYLVMHFLLRDWVEAFTGWVRELGSVGVLAFAAVYVIAAVLLLPVWPLSIAAGLAFGVLGIPLVVGSATAGASIAFLISRYFAREMVRKFAQKRTLLQAIEEAVKDEDWKVVFLLRLSPLIPFNLQNYLFGAIEVRFLAYILATFAGIIPGSAAYVYLGTLGRLAASGSHENGYQTALLVAGLLATVALVFIVGRQAKKKLVRLNTAGGG